MDEEKGVGGLQEGGGWSQGSLGGRAQGRRREVRARPQMQRAQVQACGEPLGFRPLGAKVALTRVGWPRSACCGAAGPPSVGSGGEGMWLSRVWLRSLQPTVGFSWGPQALAGDPTPARPPHTLGLSSSGARGPEAKDTLWKPKFHPRLARASFLLGEGECMCPCACVHVYTCVRMSSVCVPVCICVHEPVCLCLNTYACAPRPWGSAEGPAAGTGGLVS